MQKVYVVTGVSSGVGQATARQLLAVGNQVIGIARHAEDQTDLAQQGAILVNMDLSDNQQVAAGVATILAQTKRIDGLINVAGMTHNGPVEVISDEQAQQVIQVNVYGVMRLVRGFLPLMRTQRFGHIVNVSSIMGRGVYQPLMGWYTASKRALEALTDTLRLEVAPFGIGVSLIEPNGIATPMVHAPHFEAQFKDTAYRPLAKMMDKAFAAGGAYLTPVDDVAALVIKAATSARPRARYVIGYQSRLIIAAARHLPTRLFDRQLRKMLKW